MNTRHIGQHGRRILAVVVAGAMSVAANQRPAAPDARIQADRVAIARWAEENGLSGLSPASLSPSGRLSEHDARMAAALREIAEWARSEGLSGLSPASMHSVDD